MQVCASPSARRADLEYEGVIDALSRIYETEGFAGLYSGLEAKLLQTVLNAGIIFVVYERILLAFAAWSPVH